MTDIIDSMKDGAYYYRLTPTSRPILVEAMAGYIAEVGEGGWRPLAGYKGSFTPLVEQRPPAPHGVQDFVPAPVQSPTIDP